MTYREFIEQDKYCKENNTPEGLGCDNCPAINKEYCADALENLCNKFLDAVKKNQPLKDISKKLEEKYGIKPYNQLALLQGHIEFPKEINEI